MALRKRLILFLALAAVAVVGAVYSARPVCDWLLAQYYRQRLEMVEGREARVVLSQAADLDEAGMGVLVAGLGSSNESVSRAAVVVIRARMEDWKSRRPRYSSPLLGRLAIELAESAGHFDAEAGAEAASFAEKILARRLDRYAVDRCRVISACQKVIRAAEPNAAPRPSPDVADLDIEFHEPALARSTAREHSQKTALPLAQLAALPGGGLPKTSQPVLEGGRLDEQIERLTNRFDPRDLGESLAADRTPAKTSPENEPRWFNLPTVARQLDARQLGTGRDTQRTFNPSSPGLQLPDDHIAAADERQGTTPRPHPAVSSDMSKTPQLAKRLSQEKTVDLLHRLHGGDSQMSSAARNELRLRGFTDVHFRVADELFDPDPAVRRRLARRLPGVPGLNPQPWLLELARDTNSDVRLTALTLLATAADPAVLAEVESIARRDADNRIRRQAESMARRRVRR
ncbi:MAG: HEAT repeat domain-containing protein [Planctomycetota bacterium]|nr:HEAT repeat domain-containing protein [Planctomycetota bacterium]